MWFFIRLLFYTHSTSEGLPQRALKLNQHGQFKAILPPKENAYHGGPEVAGGRGGDPQIPPP